jgi:hypothetical protein
MVVLDLGQEMGKHNPEGWALDCRRRESHVFRANCVVVGGFFRGWQIFQYGCLECSSFRAFILVGEDTVPQRLKDGAVQQLTHRQAVKSTQGQPASGRV